MTTTNINRGKDKIHAIVIWQTYEDMGIESEGCPALVIEPDPDIITFQQDENVIVINSTTIPTLIEFLKSIK